MSDDIFDRISAKISKKCWVILLKDDSGKLTLLADPGLNRPWSANGPNPLRNQKTAEFHAKNCGGMAATWEDAFRLLRAEQPDFEKRLAERALSAQDAQKQFRLPRGNTIPDPSPSDGLAGTPLIVDKNGRPASNGHN